MSEELRPCPFCGGKAVTSTFFDWDDLEYMPIEVNDCDAEVTCENERCINGWYLSPKAWNTRPIEDALTARIVGLEAVIEILEDQRREAKNILIDKNLHIDSLYEEGYKLQQRIAELEAAQRWHVVADGELPKVGEEVFVCDESGHRRVDWLVCKPIDGVGETLFYSAAYDDDPPTHWMPLPKLPEVEG